MRLVLHRVSAAVRLTHSRGYSLLLVQLLLDHPHPSRDAAIVLPRGNYIVRHPLERLSSEHSRRLVDGPL
jgi:hypothetical protein